MNNGKDSCRSTITCVLAQTPKPLSFARLIQRVKDKDSSLGICCIYDATNVMIKDKTVLLDMNGQLSLYAGMAGGANPNDPA